MPKWLNVKSVRDFLWPTLLLFSALGLALLSTMARGRGQFYAAAFLAVISLVFAFVVCITLVPRLLARVKLDFLYGLRFFRFTQRGAFFILIVFIISFATFNTGNNLLILILSFLLASMIVSGIIANLVLFGLNISFNMPSAIHAGQKTVFLITLHNLKRFFPSFALKLRGEKKGKGKESEHTDFFVKEKTFPYLRAGERSKLRLHCEFYSRGVYAVDGFEVRTTFPFGFFWRGRKLEATGNIVVYPALHDLNAVFYRHPHLRGMEQKNRRGWGSELYCIRPYQSGDDARFVHWKSTAKLTRLMVKDFALEEDIPLSVIFSTFLPDPTPERLQQFEKAVSFVASLGHHYRSRGQEFKFSCGEFRATVNGQPRDYEALMGYLAKVQPSQQFEIQEPHLAGPCLFLTAGDSAGPENALRVDYLEF